MLFTVRQLDLRQVYGDIVFTLLTLFTSHHLARAYRTIFMYRRWQRRDVQMQWYCKAGALLALGPIGSRKMTTIILFEFSHHEVYSVYEVKGLRVGQLLRRPCISLRRRPEHPFQSSTGQSASLERQRRWLE